MLRHSLKNAARELHGSIWAARNRFIKPLVNSIRKLGGYILFGLHGLPEPVGLVNAEDYALKQNPSGGAVRVTNAYAARFPCVPTIRAYSDDGDVPVVRVARRERPIPPQFVAMIEGARVAERAGNVINADNYLLCDLPLAGPMNIKALRRDVGFIPPTRHKRSVRTILNSKIMNRGPLPRPFRYNGSIAVLSTKDHSNYYHWMIDAVPRLRLIEAAECAVDRYYVPISASYNRETLALLGIDEARCIPATRQQHVEADVVIFPSEPPGVATPEICDFLCSRLLPAALAQSRAAPMPRIYLTRRNALWRRVTNEVDVVNVLNRYGFECVALEELELADQIRLMHEAEFIVGPHGAGLTNIVFSRAGTRVVELSTPRRPLWNFHNIAACRGLRYLNLVAHQDGTPAHTGEDSNIHVDVSLLERGLEILDKSEPLDRVAREPCRTSGPEGYVQ